MTYNHAFTIAFEVAGSTTEDGSDLTPAHIRTAIANRLANIPDDELLEAVGAPFDSYCEQD